MLHKARIEGMAVEQRSNAPIVLLKTEKGNETIPIFIGAMEANSIFSALKGVRYDRPMTHDLFKNFMMLLDVHVSQVDVCDIRDDTYYAEIHFIGKDGTFTMDARPSDAIAMAIRHEAPIYIDDIVMEKSRIGTEGVGVKDSGASAEVADKSEEGKKWTDYLRKLNPDDFGKYKV